MGRRRSGDAEGEVEEVEEAESDDDLVYCDSSPLSVIPLMCRICAANGVLNEGTAYGAFPWEKDVRVEASKGVNVREAD